MNDKGKATENVSIKKPSRKNQDGRGCRSWKLQLTE